MSDEALLELAAKAVGIELVSWGKPLMKFAIKGSVPVRLWNPLSDDGDDARLESALEFGLWWYPAGVLVGPNMYGSETKQVYFEYFDQHSNDKQAARRLAGVKAAAEIGKKMK